MKTVKRLITLFLAALLIVSLLTLPALARSYSTVSNEGVELVFPKSRDMLSKIKTARVKASNGAIYLMPVPKAGNGVLGKVRSNKTVYILAERGGFYFFMTKDGRFGWNGKKYFYDFKKSSAEAALGVIEDKDLAAEFEGNKGFERLVGLLEDKS